MRHFILISLIFLILSTLLGIYIITRPTQASTTEPQTTSTMQAPLIAIAGIELHEQDKHQEYDVHLIAQRGSFDHQANVAICNGIVITINHVSKSNNQQGILTVSHAEIWRTKKLIFCSGGLQGALDNLSFTTQACRYDIDRHTIVTQSPLTVTVGPCVLTTPHTTVALDQRTFTCTGGVTTLLEF